MEMIIRFPGGARVDAEFGGHLIRTDQSPLVGGEDTAPAPFSLFLASIGTCAGIYILNFCRQRNIPTEEIRIRQNMEVNPRTQMIQLISIDVHLPSDFPAKYTSAIINSVKLCSVKKHLENPPAFKIETHIGKQ